MVLIFGGDASGDGVGTLGNGGNMKSDDFRSAVVPAQPGWNVLSVWEGDDDDPTVTGYTREPVIAWVIDSKLVMAIPITASTYGELGSCVVEGPGGSVVEPGRESWPSAESWFDSWLGRNPNLKRADEPPQSG